MVRNIYPRRHLKSLIARLSAASRTKQIKRYQPVFEPLESRLLLCATATNPGALTTAATAALIASPADLTGAGLTTTTVTPSTTDIQLGQSVTITANVATALDGGAAPTGTVTFTLLVNSVATGTQVVPVQGDGTASLTFTPTVEGFFGMSAAYSGDSNFAASASAKNTLTDVNTAPETLAMSASGYPTSVLTSAKAKAKEVVILTNPTGTAISGLQTVNVYTFRLGDGLTTKVGSVTKKLSIPAGSTKPVTVPLNFSLADGQPGIYVLTGAATNVSLQRSFGYARTLVTFAAPYVGLAATLQGDTPATFGAKPRNFITVLTLTNTGNEIASGTVTLNFTGYNAQYPLGAYPPVTEYSKASIKPGKTVTLHIHQHYNGEGTFATGTFNLFVTATIDGVNASANSENPFVVT